MLALFLFMDVERESPCKVNLLLNILGKRNDGFHELETVMHPVALFDHLRFESASSGIELTCSHPSLACDSTNLVHRAADAFLRAAQIDAGVKIHIEKRIPLAAGLGGGSGNAATTLLGLNALFGSPLSDGTLAEIGATLGSDVPFFLQSKPALATGRGERIQALNFFPALRDVFIILIHPGFGISTAWAYQNLACFPKALNGRPGRARELVSRLETSDLQRAASDFHNSLEAPVLHKYPLLALFQEYLRAHKALATLMSGSGSTTFALLEGPSEAEALSERFAERFGQTCWRLVVKLGS